MKKSLKKLLTTLSISLASIGVVAAACSFSSLTNEKNNTSIQQRSTTFNPNSSLTFNGKSYANLYAAVEDFINPVNNNISEKIYLGDVEKATINQNGSYNGYDIVDVSKLRNYDTSRLTKAYKTASDIYTQDQNLAKASYLRNPIVAWTDSDLIFDTETEARTFISKNNSATPIAFYEIQDHSLMDQFNNPKSVKINPLNTKDVNRLKKIAIDNMFINGSKFELKRFKSNSNIRTGNDEYVESDFQGFTSQHISNLTSNFLKSIINIIKYNLWYNVEISATVDPVKNSFPTKAYAAPNDQLKWWNVQAYYNVLYDGKVVSPSPKRDDYKPLSKTVKASYSTIVNDVKRLFTKEGVASVFDIVYPHDTPYIRDYFIINDLLGWKPLNNSIQWSTAAAQMKKGESLFGHKNLFVSPDFNNYWKVLNGRVWRDNVGRPDKIINFQGLGSHTNVYFGVNLNQDHLANIKNDAEWKEVIKKTTLDFNKEAREQMKKLKFDDIFINEFIYRMELPIQNIMSKSIIPKSLIGVTAHKDASIILDKLENQLSKLIYDEINKELQKYSKNNSNRKLYDVLRTEIEKKFTTNESNNNDVIYVITYNGFPLFKVGYKIFEDIYFSDEFRANPLQSIKDKIKKMLIQNYSSSIELLLEELTNVSNNFNQEERPEVQKVKPVLSKKAIDNYDSSNKLNMFEFKNEDIITEFDAKYKSMFIDQKLFSRYGATNSTFKKELNAFESDSISNLNTYWGTFEAINNYNIALKKMLSRKSPKEIQKRKLDENGVTDLNNIVNLFETNGTPKQIRYGQYFDNTYKFNESLSDDNIKIINSVEKRENEIIANKSNTPIKITIVKDLDGNIVNFDAIDNQLIVGDGYATDSQTAWNNAMNRVNVREDISKVYYKESDGSFTLLDNKLTKLNVVSISKNVTTVEYGFKKYGDMINYIKEYIKLNSTGNGSSVVDPTIVPFDVDSINWSHFKKQLAGIDDVNAINSWDLNKKYDYFGYAFGWNGENDRNKWDTYIKDITFIPGLPEISTYEEAKRENRKVNIRIDVKDGYTFSDYNTYITVDLVYEYIGSIGSVGDTAELRANRQTAMVASVTTSILSIILLEAILITIFLLNRDKEDDNSDAKLIKLIRK